MISFNSKDFCIGRILDNIGGLLQLIPNRLHTREELIDELHGLLFHGDSKAPKLILVKKPCSSIVTTQEIPNILNIVIMTKSLMNGRHSRVTEPSDDLVIFAIPIFKTVRELHVFILKTSKRLDITRDITSLISHEI